MASVSLSRGARLLDAYTARNIPVFLAGAPGIGKTSIVYDLAKERTARGKRFGVRIEQASLADPTDAKGIPALHKMSSDDYLAKWAQPDNFPRVDRDGEFGFFFLDELNTGSPAVMASFMRLILERKAGDYILPAGWIPVGAGNRQSDKASANRLPTALANRFAHIEVHATIERKIDDTSDWGHWAGRKGIDGRIIAFLRFKPDHLHRMPANGENAFPTPRQWEQVNEVMNADDDLIIPLVAGLIGDAVAGEFATFLTMVKHCPTIEQILASPGTAKVFSQQENSLCFAVTEMLLHHVGEKTFAPILTYAQRLPAEFNVSLVNAAIHKNAKLASHPAFVPWADRWAKVAG